MADTLPMEYLGDGVYASHDGHQLWLHLGSHEASPVVALEPDVLAALNRYDNMIRGVLKNTDYLEPLGYQLNDAQVRGKDDG